MVAKLLVHSYKENHVQSHEQSLFRPLLSHEDPSEPPNELWLNDPNDEL